MSSTDETQVLVVLARLDGKIDRIGDATTRSERDMTELRTEQRQQSDSLTALLGLNIQERFVSFGKSLKDLEYRIDSCEAHNDEARGEKKGIATAIRVLYATCSLVGLSTLVIVAKLVLNIGGGQ